jgi:hypothetical protein
MLSEPAPFLRDPLIKKPSGTTDKIHDHNDYPLYHIPHQKHTVSYFTTLTLISEPPTFLTRGGVPGLYDRAVSRRKQRRRRRRRRRSYRGEITRGRGYRHAITSSASRGSPPARWCVCRSLGLAGGEYYSAASSRSKVGLVLSPILTQASGRCLC